MNKLIDVVCFIGGVLFIIFHYSDISLWYGPDWPKDFREASIFIGAALITFGVLFNKWQQKDNNKSFNKILSIIVVLTLLVINLVCTNNLSKKVNAVNEKTASIKLRLDIIKSRIDGLSIQSDHLIDEVYKNRPGLKKLIKLIPYYLNDK